MTALKGETVRDSLHATPKVPRHAGFARGDSPTILQTTAHTAPLPSEGFVPSLLSTCKKRTLELPLLGAPVRPQVTWGSPGPEDGQQLSTTIAPRQSSGPCVLLHVSGAGLTLLLTQCSSASTQQLVWALRSPNRVNASSQGPPLCTGINPYPTCSLLSALLRLCFWEN